MIVPGCQPPGAPVPPALLEALRAAHRHRARIVAICTGAFVLAQAGLLDAEHAGPSGRTLARRFAEQLCTSPGQWLLARRLDAARALLEETDLPVESIATRVGLASAVNLRRRFRASLGTTPGAYRRAFGEACR